MPFLMPRLVKRVHAHQTEITWNDGHFGSYPSWYLRENCPCASCVEEWSGRRMIRKGSIPADLERVDVESVGNYALRFTWSDHHDTGIYAFDYLRALCPCPACLPAGLEEPAPKAAASSGAFKA
jgi:DUF971 family protein